MTKNNIYLSALSILLLSTLFGIALILNNLIQTLSDDSVLSDSTTSPKPTTPTYLVTKVIDGDTIQIEGGQKVRYIGIDTPETVDPTRPDGCFGKEASEKNKNLVLGKKVRLEKDVSLTDRYGRLLRYVYVDELFVNDALVGNAVNHGNGGSVSGGSGSLVAGGDSGNDLLDVGTNHGTQAGVMLALVLVLARTLLGLCRIGHGGTPKNKSVAGN